MRLMLLFMKTIAAGMVYIPHIVSFHTVYLYLLNFVVSLEDSVSVFTLNFRAGGYPSPLNYHFFPKSCCT